MATAYAVAMVTYWLGALYQVCIYGGVIVTLAIVAGIVLPLVIIAKRRKKAKLSTATKEQTDAVV